MSFKTYVLAELIEKWIDNRGKTPPLSSIGIPLLEVKNLPANGIYPQLEGTKYVNQETYDSWFRAYLKPEDILFSTVGTTARVIMTPKDKTVAIAQNVLGIRFKKEIVDSWYMFYYMRGRKFQHDIESRLVTTVQASIKRADMVGIEIELPPLSIQRSIVQNIFGLDQKIQLNHQINQTLEQMAQALFKSWFVDFEPVKAKITVLEAGGTVEDATLAAMTAISGKDSSALSAFAREQPEKYAELEATAELFPAAMQESELGEIPVGWSVQRIGSLLELVYGKALKSTNRKEGSVPVYGSGGITGFHNEPLIPHGSIIVGRKGTVGSLFWEDRPFFAIDTTYYVRPLTVPLTYCYYAMQTLGLKNMNTDAAVPGLNRENVYRLELISPPTCVLERFDTEISLLRKAIRSNTDSSKTLVSLRDTLLPKLLSGEITLPKAEQVINEVEHV